MRKRYSWMSLSSGLFLRRRQVRVADASGAERVDMMLGLGDHFLGRGGFHEGLFPLLVVERFGEVAAQFLLVAEDAGAGARTLADFAGIGAEEAGRGAQQLRRP